VATVKVVPDFTDYRGAFDRSMQHHLGTKLLPFGGSDAMLEEFGFKKATEELLMSKTIFEDPGNF
jgi:hypothetical protein